jgi:hypothetical protein
VLNAVTACGADTVTAESPHLESEALFIMYKRHLVTQNPMIITGRLRSVLTLELLSHGQASSGSAPATIIQACQICSWKEENSEVERKVRKKKLTPWSLVPLEKLTVTQHLKTFPTFYGTRRFITVFTRARHCSLPSARWIQFIPPCFISLRYILILSAQLRLVLPSVYFFLSFWLSRPNPLCIPPVSHGCYTPGPSHFLDFNILITFGKQYELWRSSLCSFVQLPIISSLFGQNILLGTLFSNTLGLCSSQNDRDQISLPYIIKTKTEDETSTYT